jgi:hypothetical protein
VIKSQADGLLQEPLVINHDFPQQSLSQLKKARVVFMRHAESVADDCHGEDPNACKFSLEPSIQDSYLSLGAHFQVDIALQSFSQLKFSTVYLSPLRRAVETALWFCEPSGNMEKT